MIRPGRQQIGLSASGSACFMPSIASNAANNPALVKISALPVGRQIVPFTSHAPVEAGRQPTRTECLIEIPIVFRGERRAVRGVGLTVSAALSARAAIDSAKVSDRTDAAASHSPAFVMIASSRGLPSEVRSERPLSMSSERRAPRILAHVDVSQISAQSVLSYSSAIRCNRRYVPPE
jgi:hypothetical protein